MSISNERIYTVLEGMITRLAGQVCGHIVHYYPWYFSSSHPFEHFPVRSSVIVQQSELVLGISNSTTPTSSS